MGLIPMIFYLTLNTCAFALGIAWQLFGGRAEYML